MTEIDSRAVESVLRDAAPRVLGAMLRRYHGFDSCEDAVQEALLAAATSWSYQGVPDNPFGWLLAVASRRWIDEVRADSSRRRREQDHVPVPASAQLDGASEDVHAIDHDDSLRLLLLCCHPVLSAPSQIALTLRAVGGLATAQIARAFFVPESTMSQRITRAKQAIRDVGAEFSDVDDADRGSRLAAMLHVLYLIFTEGHTASAGAELTDVSLSDEAIRLTRMAAHGLPDEPEAGSLLALMLLTEARRPARIDSHGRIVPLADQDRTRWRRDLIAEGTTLVTSVLSSGPPGGYALQAAIAAVHDEAATVEDTDWREILGLYDLLEHAAPGPMVSLNRAVAVAEVHGPDVALAIIDGLAADPRLAHHHRLLATRAHLKERLGDRAGAANDYRAAAGSTANETERRYLVDRAGSAGG